MAEGCTKRVKIAIINLKNTANHSNKQAALVAEGGARGSLKMFRCYQKLVTGRQTDPAPDHLPRALLDSTRCSIDGGDEGAVVIQCSLAYYQTTLSFRSSVIFFFFFGNSSHADPQNPESTAGTHTQGSEKKAPKL